MIESFWSTMQRELLDQAPGRPPRSSAGDLEWIEAWYNPRRRHSSVDDTPRPVEHEQRHATISDEQAT